MIANHVNDDKEVPSSSDWSRSRSRLPSLISTGIRGLASPLPLLSPLIAVAQPPLSPSLISSGSRSSASPLLLLYPMVAVAQPTLSIFYFPW